MEKYNLYKYFFIYINRLLARLSIWYFKIKIIDIFFLTN